MNVEQFSVGQKVRLIHYFDLCIFAEGEELRVLQIDLPHLLLTDGENEQPFLSHLVDVIEDVGETVVTNDLKN